jgi:hypothetical protein
MAPHSGKISTKDESDWILKTGPSWVIEYIKLILKG